MNNIVTPEDKDVVWLLWEDENIPFDPQIQLLEIFRDEEKADKKCKELNDKANRDYQLELQTMREKFGKDWRPQRGDEPRYSYYMNQC